MLTEKDLSTFLAERGVPHDILDPGEPTPTCEAAARALGVPVARIVKSVLFIADDAQALCILQGDQRADPRKIAAATGTSDWRLARPHEVLAHTGYPVGAVPPFLLPPRRVPVLIDPPVAREEEIVGGGGQGHLLLRCPSAAILQHNADARIVDVSRT